MITLKASFDRIAAIAILLASFSFSRTAPAADNDAAKAAQLTLDRIFTAAEFDGQSPPAHQWTSRRGGYTTLETLEPDRGRSLVWHDPATGNKEILVPSHRFAPGESPPLAIESYSFSEDESKLLLFANSKRVWRLRTRGDFWVLDIGSWELKRLGGDAPPSSLMFAKFSPDGKRVAFVRDNNLYVQDLQDMQVIQLTSDGTANRSNGTFDWIYEEELGLRDGFRWSPDGSQIAYWQIHTEGVPEIHLVNNLDSLYPQLQSIPYPKVGQRNPIGRIGIVSSTGGETRWLKIPGDPRDHYVAQMDWAGDSTRIVLQQFNRLQNTNRLMVADNVNSGDARTVISEQDSAWVENSNQHLHWVEDHQKLVWLSERDGWQHAYLVSLANGDTTRITQGSFDVISIDAVDAKGGWIYYSASPENGTQRYLYRVKLSGGDSERVSPGNATGTHTYSISDDGQWAIHTHSTFSTPPVVDLVRLPSHESVRTLAENKELKEKLAKLTPPAAELFQVNIGNSVTLDGWILLPPQLDKTKKYPLLLYVYGETAAQTVLDRWGGRRHLWHMMLAQQGYAVASFDNRGTPSPRGREWRKIVYRQIGILSAADQAAAVQALLKERTYLDPERVAVWGWSGGGSMTLNAMFRYPDLYKVGMSVAPVPNQRLYDSIYQERYMGLPDENAEGYRRGSPITYASQLKGALLLVHGTGDDNVHYQGTDALINELIANNKQFDMFAYPSRSHAIAERKNTTRHLYGLLTAFLNEKVAAGAK